MFSDGATVYIDDPSAFLMSDCYHLGGPGEPFNSSYAPANVMLRPTAPNRTLAGLQIVNTQFEGATANGGLPPINVAINTSNGTSFAVPAINTVVADNSYFLGHRSIRSTRLKRKLFKASATEWTFALGDSLLLDGIEHVQYTFRASQPGRPPAHWLESAEGNTVVVKAEAPCSATVYVEVDQAVADCATVKYPFYGSCLVGPAAVKTDDAKLEVASVSTTLTAGRIKSDDYPKQVTVFKDGEDGLLFVRIPSIIQIGGRNSAKLLAMTQCRFVDGWPTNLTMELCAKISENNGDTWGRLMRNITGDCADCNRSTPGGLSSGFDAASVWDEKREQAVVFFDTRANLGNQTGRVMVMTSPDGLTWSKPSFAFTGWVTPDPSYDVSLSAGPGLAAQLTSGPHAGRIFVGAGKIPPAASQATPAPATAAPRRTQPLAARGRARSSTQTI